MKRIRFSVLILTALSMVLLFSAIAYAEHPGPIETMVLRP